MLTFEWRDPAPTIGQRLDEMMEKLAALPVEDELTKWQREDMKRTYPNTQMPVSGERDAVTFIWPRSRTWAKQRRQRGLKRPKQVRRGKGQRVVGSPRPILRPILFERLRERMAAMMQRELRW